MNLEGNINSEIKKAKGNLQKAKKNNNILNIQYWNNKIEKLQNKKAQERSNIKERIRQHSQNLLRSINRGLVDAGYESAEKYYEKMKMLFKERCFNEEEQQWNDFYKKLKKKIDDATPDRKIMDKSFDEFFSNKNENSIWEAITSLFLNNYNEQNKIKEKIESIKKESDYKSKKMMNFFETWLKKEKEKEVKSRTGQGNSDSSELFNIVRQSMSKAVGVQVTDIAFEVDDIINKIIAPSYRNYLKKQLQSDEKINAELTKYITAKGFFFEARYAQALANALGKTRVQHSGQSNRQDDVIIKANTQNSKSNYIDLKELEKRILLDNEIVGESSKEFVDKAINVLENNTSDFGIQIKNSSLIQNLEGSKNAWDTLTRFNRISNQNDLLISFRNSVPLNGVQPILEEKNLGEQEYNMRIIQAVEFLSLSKRIIQVMGYANVGFGDNTGFTFTSDLLKTIKEKQHYLSFLASVGASQKSQENFQSAVGIRRFTF